MGETRGNRDQRLDFTGVREGAGGRWGMEMEVRQRLTALEERARENTAMAAALMGVISALPETAKLDRAEVKGRVSAMLKDRAGAAALEQQASDFVDRIFQDKV